MRRAIRLFTLVVLLLLAGHAPGQAVSEAQEVAESIHNWPAPLLWTPPAARAFEGARTEATATASAPLPFIAITPCRVADTRGNGFTGAYGPPALVANATRSFTITGQCGIPVTAAAVSFNFAALNVGGQGDLRVFPAGAGVPLVSTLNYNANTPNIANAAIVPLGTGGAITVQADAVSIDLIIDVNGYYDNSGVITGVTAGTGLTGGGTSGNVNVGIAPGGVTSTELASNAVTSAKIAANAVTAGAIVSGQVVKDLNGIHDSVTVAGSGGAAVSTVGSTITVGVPGFVPAGSFLLGNSGDTTLIGAGYTELGPSNQDGWKATSTTGAPTVREAHTAVWTGAKMIVWGGFPVTNTGGQYDPAGNSWTATTTTGAPTGRFVHTAVWTGTKMIVWGGTDGTGFLNTGGQYDPAGNSWTATTTTGAPVARYTHTAVWTGTKMIVWGGFDGITNFNTGGQYDPAGNSWTATTTTGAPGGRYGHTAVWTGTKMIVWGGYDGTNLNTGGQYDPAGNSWTATTTSGAPTAREGPTAVWTGSKMIVWGGFFCCTTWVNTGGQYDPTGDSWTATKTTGAPTVRNNHTAVWTGTAMIVWGGYDGTNFLNTGGQYDPAGDSWTATTTAGAPTVRLSHTAVWTGVKMIVWGGNNGINLNTGGQYGILSLYVKN
jgi:N-acetylneuraminic acid mutarotase